MAKTTIGAVLASTGVVALIIVLVIIGIVVLWAVAVYNGLIGLRNRVREAWAQIDVQLKRRYDLIPNLVNTVKGYAAHERGVFEKVTEARANAVAAGGSVADRAKAENMLTSALRSVFAVAEAYPQLKANENFLALQEELSSTENKISFARQHYNESVMNFNTRIQSVPSNIVAAMGNFRPEQMFELEDAAQREAPKVQF
jgi:LemA protein